MKIWTVLRESVKAYGKNFTHLMGACLVETALRAMCLAPLMFLLKPETAWLAWLCVPMYLFIALPARQNYAIALQDMLYGGRVLSPRLISFEGYFRKLGRGLTGTLKMALWMALPALAVTVLVQAYTGEGRLISLVVSHWDLQGTGTTTVLERYCSFRKIPMGEGMNIFQALTHSSPAGVLVDGFTMMGWFRMLGKDTIGGLINLVLAVMATFILPVIGCAVHCGCRHAAALEDKKLLRGQRGKLVLLWVLGFLVFAPFAAVVLTLLLSDLKTFVLGFAEMFLTKSFSVPALGEKLYIIGAAFVLLFVTMVPLKQLIPAVALHEQMKATYGELHPETERADDAQA